MGIGLRLHDPGRTTIGAGHAIERARARGSPLVESDDLLAGLLLAVSRFGIVELGAVAVDLEALGLRFDLPVPGTSVKPRYSEGAAAAFERAARIARGDGQRALMPVHLLVALADRALPTFARIESVHGLSAAQWRRLLAAVDPPAEAAPAEAASGAARAAPATRKAGSRPLRM